MTPQAPRDHDFQCPKCSCREWKRDGDEILFECYTLASAETLEVISQSPQCFTAQGRLMWHNENGECFCSYTPAGAEGGV